MRYQAIFSAQRTDQPETIVRRLIRRWWIIVLIIPSIYLICRYPPLWKDIDAFWQLAAKADAVNILQYPPVYCFLSRIPFNLASAIEGHGFHHNLLSKQTPTDLGVCLLVVAQHLALVASLAYAAKAISGSSGIGAVLCAVIFASMGGLYAQAQTCGSESWSTIAAITVFASGYHLTKRPQRSAWIVYAIGLFFAIGSRHLNLLLAAWLPAVAISTGLILRGRNIGKRTWWRTAAIACSVSVMVLSVNLIIPHLLMASIGQTYRPTIGRTLSDRVSSFLKALPPEQRIRLADQLADKQTNPLLGKAIQIQATTGLGLKGTGEELANALQHDGFSNAESLEKSDELVLAESLVYLRTFHPALLEVIRNDIWTGLSTNQRKIALSPFYSHLWAAEDMVRRPELWKYLAGYSRLKVSDAKQVYAEATADPYMSLWQHVPLWVSYVVVFVLAIGFVLLKRLSLVDLLVVVSILMVGLTMWTASMVCVYYMDRYALSLLVPMVVALVFTVGAACKHTPLESFPAEAGVSQG